jgi:hypothetical protein
VTLLSFCLPNSRRRLRLRCDVTILIINPGMALASSPEVDKFWECIYSVSVMYYCGKSLLSFRFALTNPCMTRLFKSASVYCSITVTHSFTNSRETAFSALSIDSRKVKIFTFSTSFTHKICNKSSKSGVDLSL